jgi:DNA-directed RNA polymerase specialized sigma24 family protein
VAKRDDVEERVSGAVRLIPEPYRSAASFVVALKAGEPAAVRALFRFYAPLLRDQARRLDVAPDERTELVTTVLDDFVLHLQDTPQPPHDLARYLVAAVRNRARNRHRDQARTRARGERAYSTLHGTEQRVVAECHSEYSVRAANAADLEAMETPLESAVTKLAEWSALALRPDELTLMVGVSRHMPVRDLAAQMEISYAAARVRVHRLRERFRKLVVQHAATLDVAERREVERFLRRAGIGLESRPERGRTE